MSKQSYELAIIYNLENDDELAFQTLKAESESELALLFEQFVRENNIEEFLTPPIDMQSIGNFEAVIIRGLVVTPKIHKTVKIEF